MIKRYILPAVTADGQDINVGVVIYDYAKLREWLLQVRGCIAVQSFRFNWDTNPRSTIPIHLGEFCALWLQDGIYIKMKLHRGSYYHDAMYSLDEFCRMVLMPVKCTRPSLGWCITVTVQ